MTGGHTGVAGRATRRVLYGAGIGAVLAGAAWVALWVAMHV